MSRGGFFMLLVSVAGSAAAHGAPQCATGPAIKVVERLTDLPDDIRRDVLKDGRTADAGQSYYDLDDKMPKFGAPVRRLVRAGHVGNRWFVWLEYGEFRHDEVLGFRAWEKGWQRTATWSGPPCAAMDAFMAGVEDNVGTLDHAQAYKDSATGILFFVGRDGRHVTALGPGGKIIWDVDPFAEGKLDPYRIDHPLIRYIGPGPTGLTGVVSGDYISIGYNSSQGGMIRIADGVFTFLGQD